MSPLDEIDDFMGNVIRVGDRVIAVRVPDRTPQFYTGEVVEIRRNESYGRPIVQIRVMPTGGYSTSHWHHGSYGAKLKANWIQSENVLKYPPESLDSGDESE